MSLPSLISTETISPSFIRNNYCDDEIDSSDQPIDFSKKYSETKMVSGEGKIMKPTHGGGSRTCTFNKVVKSYNSTFTMYAETDLDQPTDYSLRYAEDDSDSDECSKIPKAETTEFVQDTIKTYCTEDTPYETPFNFSTATSMSDLRIDDKTPIDNKLDAEPKQDDSKEMPNVKIVKSEFSSGLMSPEKPVNYCEEGTPGYFSRVDSCGSLNSIPTNDPPKRDLKGENLGGGKIGDKEPRRVGKFPAEGKAVKFEEVVNYAEETPLMFSRSSSLASLDSIEQHSIHDDRSSVVSDFSRLTSGLISPSELPDSPSQTVPPSPKPRKNPLVFPPIPKKKIEEELTQPPKNVPKSSVFEDVVKKFKMESTPLQFSRATSLSSLIGDHDELQSKETPRDEGGVIDQNDEHNLDDNEDINNDLSESSEDEDILAACINIGMQNNRYSQPKANTPSPRTSPPLLPRNPDANRDQKQDMTSDSLRTYCTEDTPAILSQAGSNSDLSMLSLQVESKIGTRDALGDDETGIASQIDNLKIDDLPESSSKVEQRDDLNVSLEANENGESRRPSFSSLSDVSHESEEALLQECILAGMPKSGAPEKGENLPDDAVPSFSKNPVENESSDDDEDILADCISIGMKNNRYSQLGVPYKTSEDEPKLVDDPVKRYYAKGKPEAVNDSVKSYYTEDTPAVLSHAGSSTDLSVLSMQANETVAKDFMSDLNFSDDEDERLLAECVRYGMAKMSGGVAGNDVSNVKTEPDGAQEAELSNHPPNDWTGPKEESDDDSSDSSAYERSLLRECILAGMPKPKPSEDELTPAEKALLQQCILEGMKKCRLASRRPVEDDASELTEADQALLRQCILSGMPKNKNTGRSPSAELTESERLLLQQCILAGMPKSRKNVATRRPKEAERPEHGCCVHCPRNNLNRARQKARRKYRERGLVRERGDILYVTSQILALKKEIVDRSHEEWI